MAQICVNSQLVCWSFQSLNWGFRLTTALTVPVLGFPGKDNLWVAKLAPSSPRLPFPTAELWPTSKEKSDSSHLWPLIFLWITGLSEETQELSCEISSSSETDADCLFLKVWLLLKGLGCAAQQASPARVQEEDLGYFCSKTHTLYTIYGCPCKLV